MRREDAPPPGWYPDPEGGLRLRWWEGTDWADRWRAPATAGLSAASKHAERAAAQRAEAVDPAYADRPASIGAYAGMSRADSQALVNEIRMAARAEVERAAGQFGREARSAAESLSPLISEYTSKAARWFRRLATLVVVLVIAWIVFQAVAQASFFDWIGDRVDNLIDEINQGDAAGVGRSVAAIVLS